MGQSSNPNIEHEVLPARLVTAKAWQRASAVRRECFDEGDMLFADPAWEIMLDLYIHHECGRRIRVSAATIGACVPATTALRWLQKMEDLGLLIREQDEEDGRCSFIRLTANAIRRMERAIDAAIASDQKLGLGRLTFGECVQRHL